MVSSKYKNYEDELSYKMQDWNDSFRNQLNDKPSLRSWAKSIEISKQDFNTNFVESFLRSNSEPGQTWGIFSPIKNEPIINLKIFNDLQLSIAFPKVTDEGLKFYKTQSSSIQLDTLGPDFTSSSLGVLEPNSGEFIEKNKITGLFIPGLVFDNRGFRLGRGKAYYDQFLKTFLGQKVGLTWSRFFIPAALPKDDWDIAMDYIITENFLYQPMVSATSSTAAETEIKASEENIIEDEAKQKETTQHSNTKRN